MLTLTFTLHALRASTFSSLFLLLRAMLISGVHRNPVGKRETLCEHW